MECNVCHFSDIYGYDPKSLLTSPDEVQKRLNEILGDKVLRFNPYSVDDETLLACCERARWTPWPALTQMVIFHFHEIRRVVRENNSYEAMFMNIGDDPEEFHILLNALIDKLTYKATLQQVHVMAGGRPITNRRIIESMQGKDYFVSHSLPARTSNMNNRQAYRMYRLKGKNLQKADAIRTAMIEAKIAMLEEVLAHPYCKEYLCCSRNFIDYVAPISAAIAAIRKFPEV